MNKKYLLFLFFFLFFRIFQVSAQQCIWKNIDSLDYEAAGASATVDTGINATEVYHTSPQTYGAKTGSYGLYFNVQNSASPGMIYHHSLQTCIGGRYRFSFYFKSYTGDGCLCGFTVRIYDGNTLVDSVRYSNVSNSVWQQYISPMFTSTTGAIRWELYTNVSNSVCNPSGNDLCVDDAVLKNCHYDNSNTLFVCSGNNNYNIFDSLSSSSITNITGTWTGPSTLTNGYLGTFNPYNNVNGNYLYTFVATPSGRCFADSANINLNTIICTGSCPVLHLNNDTTVCKNSIVQLKAKLDTGTISSVVWSPSWGLSNSHIYNPTTSATVDTTYVATVTALSPLTLIANGDFSLGNASFTSGYTYCSASVPPASCTQTWGLLSCAGFYTVNTSPHNTHTRFKTFGDHTTGGGNMLIVNGSTNPSISVWCQTVTVLPNTNYQFSCWFTNVDSFSTNTSQLALLSIAINGTTIGTQFRPFVPAGQWKDTIVTWNSGASTTAQICINNNATFGGGNDFALDDISFNMACTLVDSIRITVNQKPTIILPKDTFLCNSVNLPINAVYTGKPTPTLAWQNASTASSYQATTLGTYWCEATNVCGSKRDSMIISLGNAPVSVDLGLHQTLCNLDSFYLKPIAVSSTQLNYKWQDSTIVDSFKAISTGVYFVRAYNNCGSVWDTTTLTFKQKPTIDILAHETLCNQNSFTIMPTVTGSGVIHYKWQDSTSTNFYNATTSATYYVRAYNECGSVFDTSTLTFKVSPTVDLGLRKSLCDSMHYLLTPIVTGSSILNYKWQDSSTVVPFNVTSTGLYFVRVYNECGSVWDTTTIVFQNKPTVQLGRDTVICDNLAYNIGSTVTGTSPIYYVWNTGGASTSINVTQTKNYFLKATNMCGSNADTIAVTFKKSPTLTFATHSIKECFANQSIPLNPIKTGTRPLQYLWSNGSTDSTIGVNKSGTYHLTITNVCNSATDSMKVNLVPMPYKVYFGEHFTICEDTTITFFEENKGAKFWWNISTADSAITVNKSGLYVVEISNQNFCFATDSVYLKVIDCSHGKLIIPNAFTPNGDEQDDIFYPILIGDNAHLKSFKIYNRWGVLVYATNEVNHGWDGKFQNTEQPVGTYVYYIEYYDFDQLKTLKGDVTLLR